MSKVDSAAQVERLSQPAPPPSSAPQSVIPPGPVEARSLSAITTIASNPPAYPRNPTQKKLDPLVLYIVRVPGSKDVFLSPLKPPTKASVSAEAINSSLYYLHVSGPEDEVLMHEVEAEREVMRENGVGEDGDVPGSETNANATANANADFVRLNNVKRKPVGGDGGGLDSTTPATAAPSQEPPVSAQPEPEPLNHLQSGPHDQDARIPTDDPRPPPLPQRPPRRPLPPIPNEEPSLEPPESGHPGKASNRWSALSEYINSRGLENWREKYESLSGGRRRSGSDSRPRRVNSARGRATESPTRSPGRSPRRIPEDQSAGSGNSGFHITLIRRDPTHGSQWNVATMSTPRMDGSPIDIDISTPGYNRFAGQEQLSLASLGLNLPSDGRNPPGPGPKGPQSEPPNGQQQQQQQQSGPRKFHRQLCVSRPYHEDTRSSDTFTRTSTDDGSPRLKSGYYTFTSPWNGTCTFATSVNGRSLKCKHMIPLPSHTVSNPNYQPPQNPAITAAEIRFNTPFQAGHLPHQPSPNHLSPFTLSQTQTFHHQSNPSDHQPPITSPTSAAQTTSKRDTVAQFLNPNIYSRHLSRPRSRSNTNNPPQLPPRPHPHPTPTPSHKPHPSTSSTSSAGADAEDDPTPSERMDLSLAREPAGGGMRGKSAKLGKLIVEDEGVKMLDLVVAACMAVWWKGYYY